jgi:hypothetical protein
MYCTEWKRKISVVVIDGVWIGHPCCGIAHCRVPLKSNRDRFCPVHSSEDEICAVMDCTNPVSSGSKVCNLIEHQQAEKMHNMQGKSCFKLKARLKRAQFAYQSDSLPIFSANSITNSDPLFIDELYFDPVDHNGEVHFELTPDGHTIPTTTNVPAQDMLLDYSLSEKTLCSHLK